MSEAEVPRLRCTCNMRPVLWPAGSHGPSAVRVEAHRARCTCNMKRRPPSSWLPAPPSAFQRCSLPFDARFSAPWESRPRKPALDLRSRPSERCRRSRSPALDVLGGDNPPIAALEPDLASGRPDYASACPASGPSPTSGPIHAQRTVSVSVRRRARGWASPRHSVPAAGVGRVSSSPLRSRRGSRVARPPSRLVARRSRRVPRLDARCGCARVGP